MHDAFYNKSVPALKEHKNNAHTLLLALSYLRSQPGRPRAQGGVAAGFGGQEQEWLGCAPRLRRGSPLVGSAHVTLHTVSC